MLVMFADDNTFFNGMDLRNSHYSKKEEALEQVSCINFHKVIPFHFICFYFVKYSLTQKQNSEMIDTVQS